MDQAFIDRNLLFGVIALQDDLIDQEQFTDVCAGWALKLDAAIADLLIARGWISAEDRKDVERKIERKAKKHGGDIHETLAKEASPSARDAVRSADHPTLRKSINNLAPPEGYVFVETLDLPRTPQQQRSRYTLSRLHASGGLGKVWIARDTDLNREVALKEIKPEATAHPETLRRFLKEAQVTGQLEHPNIVPVYELSHRSEDDQPFYTMRFVRGRTLRQAIADDHEKRARNRADPLDRRNLLTAFVSICQAIGYAHSRGVIHRDLKPENIVLGAFGEVIVLDWGLAKMVDQPDDTDELLVNITEPARTDATQGPMGTPAYMAPEQAGGRAELVDTRTDIYGLGAILFEIVTGRPPHSGQNTAEVLARIVDRESPRIRDVDPTAPAALNAIAAKAMAKSRAARYPRALDLAKEVQRWLADEPVSVYRDPVAVRVLRWGRRHLPIMTGAAALLITAISALSLHGVLIARQKAIAVANAEEATRQRDRAERSFQQAREAVDQMLLEVGSVDLAEVPQMEAVRKRLLLKAQRYYQGFLEQKKNDPAVRGETGRAYGRLGEIEENLGEYTAAEKAFRESIAILKKDPDARAASRAELARSMAGLGVLLKKSNRLKEAEEVLRDAVRLREQLVAEAPDDPQRVKDRAATRYQLGALLARVKVRGTEDEKAYKEALKDQEAMVAKSRGNPEFRRDLARSLRNYGILMVDTGRKDEAEKTYREAIGILNDLRKDAPTSPANRWQLAGALSNLAVLLNRTQRASEAQEAFNDSLALQESLVDDFPRIPDYRNDLAAILNNQGLLLFGLGSYSEAERAFRRAIALRQKLVAEFPEMPDYRYRLASSKQNLGIVLDKLESREADVVFREATTENRKLLALYPGVTEYEHALGTSLYQLGDLQARRSELPMARETLKEAIEHERAALRAGPENPFVRASLCNAHRNLAVVLTQLGDHAGAANAAEELPRMMPQSMFDYLRAAAFLSDCVKLVRDESSLPDIERAGLQQKYTKRAVGVLRDAFEKKLINVPSQLELKELSPISDSEEFKRLQQEVKKAAPGRMKSVISG